MMSETETHLSWSLFIVNTLCATFMSAAIRTKSLPTRPSTWSIVAKTRAAGEKQKIRCRRELALIVKWKLAEFLLNRGLSELPRVFCCCRRRWIASRERGQWTQCVTVTHHRADHNGEEGDDDEMMEEEEERG